MWAIVFRIAAGFNWVAAFLLMVWPVALMADTNVHFLFRLLAMFIALFGFMYWSVSNDPTRTDYVWLGLVGKCVGVSLVWGHTLVGTGSQNLALLALGEMPFIVLFAIFLLRNRNSEVKTS